jgi:hypothetical protein
MIAKCPACGSRRFKVLPVRSLWDRMGEYVGSFRLKCTDCGCNYKKTWRILDAFYAKCPRCLRTDLTVWTEQYYRAPFGLALKIAFGARRRRCEACRHNFASFRLLKSWYKRPTPDQGTNREITADA